MPDQYRRGTRFELAVAAHLVANGYWAHRSAGSHGVADVIAIKPGQILMVQAKLDGRCDPAEWNELYGIAAHLGAVPVLAERPGRGQIRYWRLAARKEGQRVQPRVPFLVDEVAG